MSVGRFLLCLHSHMPYVLSHGKSPHGTDWIFESAAESYLPILDALNRLLDESIKPKWTINISPILAEQFDDPSFKDGFEVYCQESIETALEDQHRFAAEGSLWMEGIAAMWQRYYTKALVQFKHLWNRSLCDAFKFFQDEGSIEIITCAATHGYLALLGTEESIDAQIKVAVESHKKRFGKAPRGIWLPECAYRPAYDWKSPINPEEPTWPRKGVDQFLYENGIEYFFIDSHMLKGGEPLGTYGAQFPQLAELFARSKKMFVDLEPQEYRSEYEHYLLPSGVTCFARDPQTTVRVWAKNVGYPGDQHYLEFHKKLYPGRLRYWRVSKDHEDLGQKQPYSPWEAYEMIGSHVHDFTNAVKSTLAHYRGMSDRNGTVVSMYDTELYGHWWWEGPEFLYEMGKSFHHDPDIETVTAGELLDQEPARNVITLPEGSWGEGGYHYIWFNSENLWTWEKLYPAEKKMIEISKKYIHTPAQPIAEQAARELLLAESSDWQFLISTWAARDYAETRFHDHISRFEKLVELAEKVYEGHSLAEEELQFFRECQKKDTPFPNLSLEWWHSLEKNKTKAQKA